MAYISKRSQKRPWIPERKPFEGRIQSKFYWTASWRRKRENFLRSNPLCKHCEAQGKITPAREVDHIKPINPINAYDVQDGKFGQPLEESNLQALCTPCHLRKTGKERGREIR